MDAFIRSCLIGFSLLLLSACANNHSAVVPVNMPNANDGTTPLSEMFAQQNVCAPAWRHIYKQWMQNGGGIKSSMLATREQIALDRKSILARIIRKVWNSPKTPRAEKNRFWGWPTSENKARKLSFIFGDASNGYVPKQCTTLIWLSSIIWDDMRSVNGDPLKFRMPIEAPSNVDWDSHTAPNWVLYWLLVRIH